MIKGAKTERTDCISIVKPACDFCVHMATDPRKLPCNRCTRTLQPLEPVPAILLNGLRYELATDLYKEVGEND